MKEITIPHQMKRVGTLFCLTISEVQVKDLKILLIFDQIMLLNLSSYNLLVFC